MATCVVDVLAAPSVEAFVELILLLFEDFRTVNVIDVCIHKRKSKAEQEVYSIYFQHNFIYSNHDYEQPTH